jgi:hypothetical protein
MTSRDATGAPPQTGAARRQPSRVTGIAGLATMLLVFLPAIAQSGQEPGSDATQAETSPSERRVAAPL